MNLIVQGIVPPTKLERLQKSSEAAQLPSEVNVTFGETTHQTSTAATVLTFSGGTSEQQEQVRTWWEEGVTEMGFKTGLV